MTRSEVAALFLSPLPGDGKLVAAAEVATLSEDEVAADMLAFACASIEAFDGDGTAAVNRVCSGLSSNELSMPDDAVCRLLESLRLILFISATCTA